MSNPYAPPSRTTDTDLALGERRAPKPVRIWILEGMLAIQLGWAVLSTASILLSPVVRSLPLSLLAEGLIRPIVGVPIVGALLLSLQRLGPRPSLVAPVLTSLWWLLSLTASFALAAPPEPEALSALKFEDAPSPPYWVTAIVLHAGLLWFVLSTWLHRRTRAYLAGEKRVAA
jgi:hypothetical protein